MGNAVGVRHNPSVRPFADVNKDKIRLIFVRVIKLGQAVQLTAESVSAKAAKQKYDRLLFVERAQTDLLTGQGLGQDKIRGHAAHRLEGTIEWDGSQPRIHGCAGMLHAQGIGLHFR